MSADGFKVSGAENLDFVQVIKRIKLTVGAANCSGFSIKSNLVGTLSVSAEPTEHFIETAGINGAVTGCKHVNVLGMGVRHLLNLIKVFCVVENKHVILGTEPNVVT